MIPFRPTHEINDAGRCFYVMLCPNQGGSALTRPDAQCAGPAYTREEWEAEGAADHEFDGARWTFQGRAMAATVTSVLGWCRERSGGIDSTALHAFWEREDAMARSLL